MKYFLHDSNSFNDEKITQLFIIFGYEGLGLFYSILEKIASQEKPIKTDVLKHQLKVGKKLEKCWSFMEEIELISSNNGETFNEKLLMFSEKYKIKSEKNAKRISEWRKNQQDTKNVTRSESVCNTPKVKISKVNRSKENKEEPKGILFEIDERFKPVIKRWFEYKVKIKSAYKTEESEKACYNMLIKLSNNDSDLAGAIVEQSIAQGWKGLFELKTASSQPSFKPQENKGHVPPSKYGPDFDPSKQRF